MPDDGNGSSCQKPLCILNILEMMDSVQHNIHVMNIPLSALEDNFVFFCGYSFGTVKSPHEVSL